MPQLLLRYTEEARRVGVQGVVILKLLLSASGDIDRIRVVRRLPYGLTESAIRAACATKFKPATKSGQKVPQWATLEYGFSIANHRYLDLKNLVAITSRPYNPPVSPSQNPALAH